MVSDDDRRSLGELPSGRQKSTQSRTMTSTKRRASNSPRNPASTSRSTMRASGSSITSSGQTSKQLRLGNKTLAPPSDSSEGEDETGGVASTSSVSEGSDEDLLDSQERKRLAKKRLNKRRKVSIEKAKARPAPSKMVYSSKTSALKGKQRAIEVDSESDSEEVDGLVESPARPFSQRPSRSPTKSLHDSEDERYILPPPLAPIWKPKQRPKAKETDLTANYADFGTAPQATAGPPPIQSEGTITSSVPVDDDNDSMYGGEYGYGFEVDNFEFANYPFPPRSPEYDPPPVIPESKEPLEQNSSMIDPSKNVKDQDESVRDDSHDALEPQYHVKAGGPPGDHYETALLDSEEEDELCSNMDLSFPVVDICTSKQSPAKAGSPKHSATASATIPVATASATGRAHPGEDEIPAKDPDEGAAETELASCRETSDSTVASPLLSAAPVQDSASPHETGEKLSSLDEGKQRATEDDLSVENDRSGLPCEGSPPPAPKSLGEEDDDNYYGPEDAEEDIDECPVCGNMYPVTVLPDHVEQEMAEIDAQSNPNPSEKSPLRQVTNKVPAFRYNAPVAASTWSAAQKQSPIRPPSQPFRPTHPPQPSAPKDLGQALFPTPPRSTSTAANKGKGRRSAQDSDEENTVPKKARPLAKKATNVIDIDVDDIDMQTISSSPPTDSIFISKLPQAVQDGYYKIVGLDRPDNFNYAEETRNEPATAVPLNNRWSNVLIQEKQKKPAAPKKKVWRPFFGRGRGRGVRRK